ncbi:MAG: hypothetical protein AB1634_10495 [Thermodesulfobacteriota bacterium]
MTSGGGGASMRSYSYAGQESARLALGLDRAGDERFLAALIQRAAADQVLARLLPRLTASEIGDLVDSLTGLLRRHLTHAEYHRLLMDDALPAESDS